MNIQVKDYTIEQEVNSPTKFNLMFERVVPEKSLRDGTPNKDAGEVKRSTLAYGISIPRAIELIVHYELLDNDDIVSMKEFVSEYKKITEEIKQLVQL